MSISVSYVSFYPVVLHNYFQIADLNSVSTKHLLGFVEYSEFYF